MKLIERKQLNVVGIEVQAGFNDLFREVPKAWQEFINRLDEVSHRKGDTMLDVSLKVEDGVYTQIVGVEVSESGRVPEGMVKVVIPEQKYICCRHTGAVEQIASSFGEIYDWAEQNGHKAEDFKIDEGYLKDGSESEHHLYVKIKS